MTKKAVKAPGESDDAFGVWAKAYRAAAKRDRHGKLAERLEELGFTVPARDVVENTIRRVALVCAYYGIDGRDGLDEFLRLQTYDVAASSARYLLRFEPYEVAFLLIDEKNQVDLVDLFNSPPGFFQLDIERVDGKPFPSDELESLSQAIQDDFNFDFEPDEITLEIDANEHGIQVRVCEADQTPPWR